MRVEDIAHVMIEMLAGKHGHDPAQIEVTEIGVKAGEKLYEELMSEEEMHRALELKEMFAVLPAFRSVYENIDYNYPGVVSEEVDNPYASAESNAMKRAEIREYLEEHRIL